PVPVLNPPVLCSSICTDTAATQTHTLSLHDALPICSQIFEAVGISKEVIDKYFTGTVSRVGGIGLEDIQADVEARHSSAFDPLGDRKSTRLNSSHVSISYAVFCLKKKK